MNKYEAVFILDPRKVDDEGKAFSQEVATLITSLGGTVDKTDYMGRRPFVREIKKRKAGYYVDMFFAMPPTSLIEIRNKFRLDERMLRMLVILDERPADYNPEPIVLS